MIIIFLRFAKKYMKTYIWTTNDTYTYLQTHQHSANYIYTTMHSNINKCNVQYTQTHMLTHICLYKKHLLQLPKTKAPPWTKITAGLWLADFLLGKYKRTGISLKVISITVMFSSEIGCV